MWVAELLSPLGDLPVLATITVACIIVTTLTEVTSNAATITIFLPILSPLVGSVFCSSGCRFFSANIVQNVVKQTSKKVFVLVLTPVFLELMCFQAEAIHVNPLYVLIPTTLCTSFSFLLPVSNPSNAVVFTYGHISIMDMVGSTICRRYRTMTTI